MAPQNLNQVFVINNPDMYSTTTFSNNAAVTGSRLGAWDLDAATPTNIVTALFTSGVPNFKRIQFTQTMPTGNVIATPIIDLKNIKRINYREWTSVAPTVALQTLTYASDPSASKNVMIRIALRTAPTIYNDFAAPNSAYSDLSGDGYTFPLVGNFAAGRMIFNIEIAAATHGGTAATLATAIYNAVLANKTLNAIFKVANGSSGVVTFTARHYGVEFDLISQYSDGSGAIGAAVLTHPTAAAASNYLVALSDEKKQRAKYGNFNRMYFPFAFPEFAQPGYKYDVIELQYAHAHPADTGIARANELNTLRIYVGASSTALSYAGASTGTEVATVFGFTGGTDSEQLF